MISLYVHAHDQSELRPPKSKTEPTGATSMAVFRSECRACLPVSMYASTTHGMAWGDRAQAAARRASLSANSTDRRVPRVVRPSLIRRERARDPPRTYNLYLPASTSMRAVLGVPSVVAGCSLSDVAESGPVCEPVCDWCVRVAETGPVCARRRRCTLASVAVSDVHVSVSPSCVPHAVSVVSLSTSPRARTDTTVSCVCRCMWPSGSARMSECRRPDKCCDLQVW